ncbi:hypothetical protein [Halalkalicoccus salilacus]|uniref:hypothetical protein n=1 Tax=Halalkalicoccus salilacus TaxID=3117459 RepID=UPI00300EEEDF
MATISTYQIAQFIAINRDFDDTEPDHPDMSGTVDTEPYLAIRAYSEGRTDAPGDLLSEANRARLDVLTGGGEWIEVTPEDMAAARHLQNGE